MCSKILGMYIEINELAVLIATIAFNGVKSLQPSVCFRSPVLMITRWLYTKKPTFRTTSNLLALFIRKSKHRFKRYAMIDTTANG